MLLTFLVLLLVTVKICYSGTRCVDNNDRTNLGSLYVPCSFSYTRNHRIHKASGKCYVIGYQGPQCVTADAYFLDHDGTFGKCVCSRPDIVFGNGTCQYPKNSQGPCPAGQIWRYSEDHLEATCQPSPCGAWVKGELIADLILWEGDGKCYIQHARGPCGEGEKLVLAGKEEAECVEDLSFPSEPSGTFENSGTSPPFSSGGSEFPPLGGSEFPSRGPGFPSLGEPDLSEFAPVNETDTIFGFDTLNTFQHTHQNPRFDVPSGEFHISFGAAASSAISDCPQGTVRQPGSEACIPDNLPITLGLCSSGKKRHPIKGCN